MLVVFRRSLKKPKPKIIMDNDFEKAYQRIKMSTYWLGVLLIASIFFFFIYLSQHKLIFPLFDDSRLDRDLFMIVGALEITVIYFLPYLLFLFIWRLRNIDYVDQLANPIRLHLIHRAQVKVIVGSHFSCWVVITVGVFGPHLVVMPLPFFIFGFLLVKASQHIKRVEIKKDDLF